MCGRFTLAGAAPAELRGRFPLGESVEIRERFNVAPGDDILTVTTGMGSHPTAPRGELLRWGLVPHWAKELKTCFSTINARAETLDRKPEHSRVLAVLTYLRESKS
jgi:putative SOS response-associated peptidase YedK